MSDSQGVGTSVDGQVNAVVRIFEVGATGGDWSGTVADVWNMCNGMGGKHGNEMWLAWCAGFCRRFGSSSIRFGKTDAGSFTVVDGTLLQGCDRCSGDVCVCDKFGTRRNGLGVGQVGSGAYGVLSLDHVPSDFRGRCQVESENRPKAGECVKNGEVGFDTVGGATLRSGVARSVESAKTSVGGAEEKDCVSEKTLANRERRKKKKERKLRRQAGGSQGDDVPEWRRKPVMSYRGAFELCDEETRRKLAETRAKRLIFENEASVRRAQTESERWTETVKLRRKSDNLKMLKVSQQIELVRSQDVEKLKRRQESKVLRDTETNKVEVERAFGTLAITGNVPSSIPTVGSMSTIYEETVPSLVGGKVCTIKSGSISPNSSASEAEVRKLQKDFVDLESENVKLRKSKDVLAKKLENLRFAVKNNSTDAVKVLLAEDCPEMYEESYGFSVDEDGNPCCSVDDAYEGYIDDNGRFHFGQDPKVMWDLA